MSDLESKGRKKLLLAQPKVGTGPLVSVRNRKLNSNQRLADLLTAKLPPCAPPPFPALKLFFVFYLNLGQKPVSEILLAPGCRRASMMRCQTVGGRPPAACPGRHTPSCFFSVFTMPPGCIIGCE